MLISFFNPSDLIGCGGGINQSDSFRYAEGVRGGVHGGGMWRGYMEGVCRGGMQRGYPKGYAKGVHGGGMQRGYMEGCTEGCMEGCVVVVAPSNHKFNG